MNISENTQDTFRRVHINPFATPGDRPEEYQIVVEQHREKIGAGWERATVRTRTPPGMNAEQCALFAEAQKYAEKLAAQWNEQRAKVTLCQSCDGEIKPMYPDCPVCGTENQEATTQAVKRLAVDAGKDTA